MTGDAPVSRKGLPAVGHGINFLLSKDRLGKQGEDPDELSLHEDERVIFMKMNNQSSINKTETGIDENNNITGSAEDTIVNLINNTLVRDYIVEKVEIFYTHHKSYRAYVKIKVSKDNVSLVIQEIKADKKLLQNNKKKQNKLTSKVKEVLKNLD